MLTDLVRSLAHPSELWAIAAFVYDTKLAPRRDQTFIDKAQTARLKGTIVQDTHEQCYHFLNLTSRSFAAVVQALHPELRDAICLFYLVLRGLDTVEDDMTIARDEVKVPLLRCFHEKLTVQGWQFHGNDAREKDRALLQHFDVVIAECARLKPAYLAVIVDICKRMGGGMADFAAVQKIGTRADWNLYCHYVAGLVGVGLCRMFAASGLEDRRVADVEDLANSMGLFLQKVNIIRDYLEDFVDGRTFWPEEVWSKHGKTLGDLRLAQNEKQARACLNELIADALELIPDCLQFMSMLKEPSVFKFCAIPQVYLCLCCSVCFFIKTPEILAHTN